MGPATTVGLAPDPKDLREMALRSRKRKQPSLVPFTLQQHPPSATHGGIHHLPQIISKPLRPSSVASDALDYGEPMDVDISPIHDTAASISPFLSRVVQSADSSNVSGPLNMKDLEEGEISEDDVKPQRLENGVSQANHFLHREPGIIPSVSDSHKGGNINGRTSSSFEQHAHMGLGNGRIPLINRLTDGPLSSSTSHPSSSNPQSFHIRPILSIPANLRPLPRQEELSPATQKRNHEVLSVLAQYGQGRSVDETHCRPGLPMTFEQYNEAKHLILDILGFGVTPEQLVEMGLNKRLIVYCLRELNLRIPHNVDITDIIPYEPPTGMTFEERPPPSPPPVHETLSEDIQSIQSFAASARPVGTTLLHEAHLARAQVQTMPQQQTLGGFGSLYNSMGPTTYGHQDFVSHEQPWFEEMPHMGMHGMHGIGQPMEYAEQFSPIPMSLDSFGNGGPSGSIRDASTSFAHQYQDALQQWSPASANLPPAIPRPTSSDSNPISLPPRSDAESHEINQTPASALRPKMTPRISHAIPIVDPKTKTSLNPAESSSVRADTLQKEAEMRAALLARRRKKQGEEEAEAAIRSAMASLVPEVDLDPIPTESAEEMPANITDRLDTSASGATQAQSVSDTPQSGTPSLTSLLTATTVPAPPTGGDASSRPALVRPLSARGIKRPTADDFLDDPLPRKRVTLDLGSNSPSIGSAFDAGRRSTLSSFTLLNAARPEKVVIHFSDDEGDGEETIIAPFSTRTATPSYAFRPVASVATPTAASREALQAKLLDMKEKLRRKEEERERKKRGSAAPESIPPSAQNSSPPQARPDTPLANGNGTFQPGTSQVYHMAVDLPSADPTTTPEPMDVKMTDSTAQQRLQSPDIEIIESPKSRLVSPTTASAISSKVASAPLPISAILPASDPPREIIEIVDSDEEEQLMDDDDDVIILDPPLKQEQPSPPPSPFHLISSPSSDEDDVIEIDGNPARPETNAAQGPDVQYVRPTMLRVLATPRPLHPTLSMATSNLDSKQASGTSANLFVMDLTPLEQSVFRQVDPTRTLCRFTGDGGTCLDSTCRDIHWSDLEPSDEKTATYLMDYYPNLSAYRKDDIVTALRSTRTLNPGDSGNPARSQPQPLPLLSSSVASSTTATMQDFRLRVSRAVQSLLSRL